jgi:hypothetical protein
MTSTQDGSRTVLWSFFDPQTNRSMSRPAGQQAITYAAVFLLPFYCPNLFYISGIAELQVSNSS